MMRSLVCVVVVMLVGGAAAASGQDRQVGLKAGVNVSSVAIEGDGAGAYEQRRLGFLGGGFLVRSIGGPLAVQIEALFSQKGARLEVEEENLEATLELDYLDIPVMLRLQGPSSGATRLHIFGGPSVSYRMGARRKLSDSSFEFTEGVVDNIENEIERFDLGVVVGAGADIGRRVVVDARYSWGLATVNKDTSQGVEIKNRVFSVMAGVRF